MSWNGASLAQRPIDCQTELRVSISARRPEELIGRLRERAYTCPIPLTENGRRLDALQMAHGPTSHPYHLAVTSGGRPLVVIPPATYQRRPTPLYGLNLPQPAPDAVGAICVVALRREDGREPLRRRESIFHWVMDGVVIETHPLTALEANACGCFLYASAADHPLDLSGFKLADPDHAAQEIDQICRSFLPELKNLKIDLTTFIRTERSRRKKAGVACAARGSGIIWFGGLGLMASGRTRLSGEILPKQPVPLVGELAGVRCAQTGRNHPSQPPPQRLITPFFSESPQSGRKWRCRAWEPPR